MPTKRKARKQRNVRLTPELRSQIARADALQEDHMRAIRGEDEAFYVDGRHEEMVRVESEVRVALGLRPLMKLESK